MKTYQKSDLEIYLQNDWIYQLLSDEECEAEKGIRTNEWMSRMENKRMVYADVYGDILKFERGGGKIKWRVLDVGGGFSALTKVLARNADYTLVDFLAHGGNEYVRKQDINLLEKDWNEADLEGPYDLVIANDIFPDVDQRMELFIDRMLPICRELRLVLTYYNSPKFYTTKRTDDSEIMTFLSWDGEITALKLKKYVHRLYDTTAEQIEEMKNNFSSIYWNGRQVSYVRIKGDLA